MTEEEFAKKYPSIDGMQFERAARQVVLHVKPERKKELDSGEFSDKLIEAIEAIWAVNISIKLGIPPIRSALCIAIATGQAFTLQEISYDAMLVTVELLKKYTEAVRRAKERMNAPCNLR